MKRSRVEISNEYIRNVRAKKSAEENMERLDAEYERHPDTISERLHESIRFLVTDGRITEYETNHTLQNYGYMKVESWICKFTLDQKVYIGFIGRSFKRREKGKWGDLCSMNRENSVFFELIGQKKAEAVDIFSTQELRDKVLAKEVVPAWKWALETQYNNEPRAIVLLCHLHSVPDDTQPTFPSQAAPPPTPLKDVEGFNIVVMPYAEEDSDRSE